MKKLILSTFFFTLFFIQHANSAVVVENLNLKVNAANPSLDLKFSNFQAGIFQVNYFAIPGSVSFIGKTNTEFNSTILVESIGGGNYTPIRLYNNQDFTNVNSYVRNPVFIHNNNLTFTNNFKGKGNQYIGARILFPLSNDTMFVWFLINLNANGDELNILKVAYDDASFGSRPITGNDGENKPTTGLNDIQNTNFNLYPQPASETINIMMNAYLNSYSIFNLNGQVIESQNQKETQIDVAHLPKGVYIIEVNSTKGIIRRKFLKD